MVFIDIAIVLENLSIIEPPVEIVRNSGPGKAFHCQHKPCQNDAQCRSNHIVRGWVAHHFRGFVYQFMKVDGFVNLLKQNFGVADLFELQSIVSIIGIH